MLSKTLGNIYQATLQVSPLSLLDFVVEARELHQPPPSVPFCLISMRQILKLANKLGYAISPESSQDLPISAPTSLSLQGVIAMPGFTMGAGDWNSGPHACPASSLIY